MRHGGRRRGLGRGYRGVSTERVLEAAHAVAERAAHLGQPLCAEHEQQQYQQECDVNWIVESHVGELLS